MLVQRYWLPILLFTASATARLSTCSSHHSTSTTKKTTVPTSSTHHTSTSTIKKTSTSTKSSTKAPTSTPSTFYLVAADTGSNAFDGSYFRSVIDPFPVITISEDSVIQSANKNPVGASNFTLLANGTLQCNSPSGPLVACVSNGHPTSQTFMFEDPDDLDRYGFVAATCAIANAVLSCQWGPLVNFYYDPSNVQNGKQVGDYVVLGLVGDGTPFTIRVVPT